MIFKLRTVRIFRTPFKFATFSGFGRSARPNFSSDGTLAELELVETIEDWRKEMGIDKMYLVGHSFGKRFSELYPLKNENIKILILSLISVSISRIQCSNFCFLFIV